MSRGWQQDRELFSDLMEMLDQSCNLGSSSSCPTTKLHDLGPDPMVSAFSVISQKVVVGIYWNNVCEKVLKKYKALYKFETPLSHYPYYYGGFWAKENDFYFSCFPSFQTTTKNLQKRLSQSSVWIPLGKWGSQFNGLFLKHQPKVLQDLHTKELLGHGDEGVHKCYINILAIVFR